MKRPLKRLYEKWRREKPLTDAEKHTLVIDTQRNRAPLPKALLTKLESRRHLMGCAYFHENDEYIFSQEMAFHLQKELGIKDPKHLKHVDEDWLRETVGD